MNRRDALVLVSAALLLLAAVYLVDWRKPAELETDLVSRWAECSGRLPPAPRNVDPRVVFEPVKDFDGAIDLARWVVIIDPDKRDAPPEELERLVRHEVKHLLTGALTGDVGGSHRHAGAYGAVDVELDRCVLKGIPVTDPRLRA